GGLGREHRPPDAAQTLLLCPLCPGRPRPQAPEPEGRPRPCARDPGGGAGGAADPAGLAAKASFPSIKSVLYYNTRVYLKTPQRCSILPERPICRVAFACIPSKQPRRARPADEAAKARLAHRSGFRKRAPSRAAKIG